MNQATTVDIARSLQKLYFLRAAFSVGWVVLVSLFVKANSTVAYTLLIIYPVWDVFASFLDIKANPPHVSKTFQYINIAIGLMTTACVALALQSGIPQALMVFGGWAFITGFIQLVLGLRRRKELGGQ